MSHEHVSYMQVYQEKKKGRKEVKWLSEGGTFTRDNPHSPDLHLSFPESAIYWAGVGVPYMEWVSYRNATAVNIFTMSYKGCVFAHWKQ